MWTNFNVILIYIILETLNRQGRVYGNFFPFFGSAFWNVTC